MKKPTANAIAAIACAGGVMFMTGAAFAAVPLYRMFCQVTGFDGTVRKADKAPDVQLDQTVLIRFDTNVRGLPMTFRAEQVTQRVRIGETGMAFFDVTNTSDAPISATISPGATLRLTRSSAWQFEKRLLSSRTSMAAALIEFAFVI